MDDDLFSINMNLVLLGTNIKYIDFLYDDYKIKQENNELITWVINKITHGKEIKGDDEIFIPYIVYYIVEDLLDIINSITNIEERNKIIDKCLSYCESVKKNMMINTLSIDDKK